MTIYRLEDQVDTMLKYFYGGNIELMIERINDISTNNYTEHSKDDIVKYLRIKLRKQKLEKIKRKL